jgi:hypothetical protein
MKRNWKLFCFARSWEISEKKIGGLAKADQSNLCPKTIPMYTFDMMMITW